MTGNSNAQDVLSDLAADPRLIPQLLQRAKEAIAERAENPMLRNFLPAFQKAKEALDPRAKYVDPTSGKELEFDRQRLREGIDQAEREVVQALSAQR